MISLSSFPPFIQRECSSDWAPFPVSVVDTVGGTPITTGQYDAAGNLVPATGPSNRGVTALGTNVLTPVVNVPTGGPFTFRVYNTVTNALLAQSTAYCVGDIRALIGNSQAFNLNAVGVSGSPYPQTAVFKSGTWSATNGAGLSALLGELYNLTGVPQAVISSGFTGASLTFDAYIKWLLQGTTLPCWWNDNVGAAWSGYANDINTLGNNIAGAVVLLGEQDAIGSSASTYFHAMNKLWRLVQQSISSRSSPDLGCAVVELADCKSIGVPNNRDAIRAGQRQFCGMTPGAYLVASVGELPRDSGGVHYTDAGYALLGSRIAKAIYLSEYTLYGMG